MTESMYKEYQNKYYNPNDNDKKPGDNDNWKSIQKGFHDISEKQLETSAGLTLGKGTEDETSVTAGELKEIKDPTQLETSGGLTLGKGTEDETSVTAAELEAMKSGGDEYLPYFVGTLGLSGTLRANTVEKFDANNPDTFKEIVRMLRAKGYTYITLKACMTINNANPDTYTKMAILDVGVEDNNRVVSVNMFPLNVDDEYLANIHHLCVRCFNYTSADITIAGSIWFFAYPNKYVA